MSFLVLASMNTFAASKSSAANYYFSTDMVTATSGVIRDNCSGCHSADNGNFTCDPTLGCTACVGTGHQPDFLDWFTASCFSTAISSQLALGKMPPGVNTPNGPTMLASDIQKIQDWISNGAVQYPITGPAPPILSVSAPTIPETIVKTTSSPFTFLINNSGGQSATGCSVSISNPIEYSWTSSCSTILTSQSCPVVVTFSPTAAGARPATLTVLCSGPNTNGSKITPQTINGIGGTPPKITVNANPFSFDTNGSTTMIGTSSPNIAKIVFTITGLPASLSGFSCNPTITGPFSIISNPNICSFQGQVATASCTFSVKATPTVVGVNTGSINLDCPNISASLNNTILKITGSGCQLFGQYPDPSNPGNCICPPKYTANQSACRPNNPTYAGSNLKTDFFQTTDPARVAESNGYPICGPNRIAIGANNTPLDISSSMTPNSTVSVDPFPGDPGYLPGPSHATYLYATKDSNSLPVYLYPQGSRCACTKRSFGGFNSTDPMPAATNSIGTISPFASPIPPDHYTAISSVTSMSQHGSNPMQYSPVAIDRDPSGSVDGRQGIEFLNDNATCGCPNINETMVLTNPNYPNTPQGSYCISLFADPATGIIADKNVVLVTYNPSLHNKTGSSQVYSVEPKDPDDTSPETNIISKIALPTSIGSVKTQTYTRRIWTCAAGFIINRSTTPFTCLEPNTTMATHSCSDGTSAGLPSAVSTEIAGPDPYTQFKNAVNKKLNCCLNDHTKGLNNYKFDCIDNSAENNTPYTSFDTLWSGSDFAGDGGQPFGIILSNASGKPISGYYTVKGVRCDQYSEFFGDGRYSKLPGYAQPSSQKEKEACPILVRAAITATCSKTNPPLPAIQTYYEDTSIGAGLIGRHRCTSAEKITMHIQIKQVTPISGVKPMKTYDTVASPSEAANINVKKIIGAKNAAECSDGSTRVGSQCIYQ